MTGPRPPEPTRDILNIEEAAHLLGVSTKTFAKVLREGEIPGRKIGREWKFSRRALIDWVAAGRSADFLDLHDGAQDGADDERESEGAPQLNDRGGMPPLRARPVPPRRAESEMSVEED
jgi:excisionase family DNA binding protein